MKEEVKGDAGAAAAFAARHRRRRLARARGLRARPPLHRASALDPYRSEFGRKSIWSHEFIYPTWYEQPAPILAGRARLPRVRLRLPGRARARQATISQRPCAELMDGVPPGEGRDRLQAALDASLGSTRSRPTTTSSSTRARTRGCGSCSIAIGRKLAAQGALDDAEDVFFLKLQRAAHADRRRPRGRARPRLATAATSARTPSSCARPTGSAPPPPMQLAFPYLTLWGFPEKFDRPRSTSRRSGRRPGGVARRRRGPGARRLVARPVQRGARTARSSSAA